MEIKILIAAHKAYLMPKSSIYMPLHVGKAGKQDLGFMGDNTGDNISAKNGNYCELTGLYWAWKNLEYDYIGLIHYRRYFNFINQKSHFFQINIGTNRENIQKYAEISEEEIKSCLYNYDIILPKRMKLEDTIENHYKKCHISSDWELLRGITLKLYPEYKDDWEIVTNATSMYAFNMFITNKGIFDEYMKWLFSILFEVEKCIVISKDPYQSRVFGFMSERLFNIFLYHRKLRIKELPIVFFEEKISIKRKIKNTLKKIIDLI